MSGFAVAVRALGTFGVILLVALALAVAVALVLWLGFATALLGVPEMTAVESSFDGANESVTVVDSRVTVHNPNPVTISIDTLDVHHRVSMNGIPMGAGERRELDLPEGNSTVEVRTAIRNDRIVDWWVTHLRRGERTNLTVETTVNSTTVDRSYSRTLAERTVRTDIVSVFETNRTVPLGTDSPLGPGPAVYVNRTTAEWEYVGENRTVARADLTVTNTRSIPIPVENVTYDVSMNGVAVGNGSTRNLSAIPPGSTRNVTAMLVIDNGELDDWWPTHVERNQTTDVRFDYTVTLDLSRYGGGSRTVSPPPVEHSFETDVFGKGEQRDELTIDSVVVADSPAGAGDGSHSPSAASSRSTSSALPM